MIYDIQKARVIKRLSAALLDIILLAVLAVGMAAFISWVSGYNKYSDAATSAMTTYLEEFKDYIVDENTGRVEEGTYNSFTQEQKDRFQELRNIYFDNYEMMVSLQLVIISVSAFFSVLVLEFIIPLCFKNGQTVGKKAFSIGVVHMNSIRVNPLAMFIRSFLGKYAIEIMVPAILILMLILGILGIVGIVILLLIVVLVIGVFIGTKNKLGIHDLLAKTVVVDMSTQMIFDSEEDLIAYKKSLTVENAENTQAYDKDAIPGTGENAPYKLPTNDEETTISTAIPLQTTQDNNDQSLQDEDSVDIQK